MEQMHFIYLNAQGIYAAHSIFHVSSSKDHFQGICCTAREIRTFRWDRVLEQCSSQQAAIDNLGNISQKVISAPYLKKANLRKKSDSISALRVLKKKIEKGLLNLRYKMAW